MAQALGFTPAFTNPCRTLLLRELGPGADGYLLSAVEPGELALEQSGALVARGCSREEARLDILTMKLDLSSYWMDPLYRSAVLCM